MAKKPICLVCQKEMERGFITETADLRIPRWCPGDPQGSWFGEAKSAQAREGIKVVAYRCPECEALRLYAPSSQSE